MGNDQTHDDTLMRRFLAKDPDAFTEIYQKYFPLLFQHCKRVTRNDDLAKDIAQDVFTNFLAKGAVAGVPLGAQLFTVMRGKIIDGIRREKIKGRYLDHLECMMEQWKQPSVLDELVEKESQMQLEREIALLPSKMRKVFELRQQDIFSYKEIATHTGSAPGTIKKQIHLAIKVLKSRIITRILF